MGHSGFSSAFGARALVLFVSVAGGILAMGNLAFADTVVVSPIDMGNWSFVATDDSGNPCPTCGSGSMVYGPGTPLLGLGSANLQTELNDGQYASAIVSSALNGQYLSAITALSYSTYDTTNNGQQFPYLQLMVSWAGGAPVIGSSGPDDILTFEPPYQTPATNGGTTAVGNITLPNEGATVMTQWQTWDALNGGWYDALGTDGSFGGSGGLVTLAQLAAALPAGATITADWNGNGGTELLVGYGSLGENFDGNVDNVTIGISGVSTTYDFEPVPEPGTFVLFAGAGLIAAVYSRRKLNLRKQTL